MSTAEYLKIALGSLQQATAADIEGCTASALPLYLNACVRFESLLCFLPEAHADVVRRHVESVRQRIDVLRSEKGSKGPEAELPQFPVEFRPISLPEEGPFVMPAAAVLRPFWMMRVLSRSMQEGAFVTPDLFVPKEVWHQDGAATVVAFIGAKIRFLSTTFDAMEPFQKVTHLGDARQLVKILDSFLRKAEAAKSAFDQEVGKRADEAIAQRSRWERGVRELLHRGQQLWKTQQGAGFNTCVTWAVNVLGRAQILDPWIQSFLGVSGGPAEVLERLHKTSAFFFFGPCSFILQDMLLLCERYQEKSRESFSRLLPVEVKFVAQE
jgi:hypothetical protein